MSTISLWRGYANKVEDISLDEFLNRIKYGTWRTEVEKVRAIQDKAKQKIAKGDLPSVTVSGTFPDGERKEANLITHSGYICIDIDNQALEAEQLKNDPYTFAFFRSASGNGAAIIVKVNPEKHKESYRWLSEYYFMQYGLTADDAPKNPASLRFVSFDPDLFINDKAIKSKSKSDKVAKPKSMPYIGTSQELDRVVQEIMDKGLSIAESYEDYRNLGFALAEGYGEQGRGYFHTLCSMSPKYRTNQADKQFDISLKRAKGGGGITVGTFWYMVKNAGITIDYSRKKELMTVAAVGKKSGRQKESVIESLTTINGLDPNEASELVNQIYNRNDIDVSSLAKGGGGNIITSLAEFIEMNHRIRRNAITGRLEESGTEIRAERMNTIYLKAQTFFEHAKIPMDIFERILYSEMIKDFNPFDDYINMNQHRKGSGNIDKIIATISTDTPMAAMFIRKWMLSWFAAMDGHPVRSVLALCGGQNSGKTEWFRRLLPDALKRYYAESKMDAGKDDEILMCQRLIVMDDEMGGKSKQDEKRFKELTSKSIFSLRAPYARHNEDYKRLAVMCGTANDPNIINDSTGNTRILPVTVKKIDHDLYNSVSKDELFMELWRAYQSGEEWQLTRAELDALQEISQQFEVIPFERELISQFFAKPDTTTDYMAVKLTATEIKTEIENYTRQQIRNMTRFGIELKNVLGNSLHGKRNGVMSRYYRVVRLTDAVNPKQIDYETLKRQIAGV